MELSEVHLFVIGLVATGLIWAVKFWREQSGKPIPSGWLTAGVYVVSFGLALAFGLPAIPPFGPFNDPISFVAACLQWLTDFLVIIGPFVGFATLIYNALLKKVLDGIGEQIQAKSKGLG